ncbi:MAG: hypothetical protein AAGH65_01555 [Pseudomonadota bacterium]
MNRFIDTTSRCSLALFRWLGQRTLPIARRRTRWLAHPLRWLMRRRRRIVARNLELCFPDASAAERRSIEQAHFRELAESLGEIAYCWRHQAPLDASVGDVTGLDFLEAARRGKQGIILLTGHTCSIELGGRLLCERLPITGVYRPLHNAQFESYQTTSRLRYAKQMLARENVRGMVRTLRNGGILWTAMDQDFGPERSLFAPFFELPTATAKGLLDLARLGRARVHPVYPFKDPHTGVIEMRIEPAFEPFPSDDPVADLASYNAFLEHSIRVQPAPYWWLHRRFKTAPKGAAPRYQ